MAVTVFKTFAAGEILTASDLNSSFSKIVDNGEDLGWPATKARSMDRFELTLDDDGDSGIVADTDDRIDLKLSGSDLFRFDGTVTTPVNGMDFIASAGTDDVVMDLVGTAADISLDIQPKGTGTLKVNGVDVESLVAENDDNIIANQVFSY